MDILRNKKTTTILLSSIILPIIFSTPANADELSPQKIQTQIILAKEKSTTQKLETLQYKTSSSILSIEKFEEIIQPPPVEAPSAQQTSNTYENLVASARAQIGIAQDCTALVENALRKIGINVGDLSPMGFASLGTKISPDQIQAGDIMMRGGHVAIYTGNGMAIHGGFNGSTVETSYDANPYNYSVIVRI
jgi:hypothetical protein